MELKPMIGSNLKIGKPRVKSTRADRERQAERLDGSVKKGESVPEYHSRMLRQINSLDWGSQKGDEPSCERKIEPLVTTVPRGSVHETASRSSAR